MDRRKFTDTNNAADTYIDRREIIAVKHFEAGRTKVYLRGGNSVDISASVDDVFAWWNGSMTPVPGAIEVPF